jgi:nitrogen fixation/metabolism regulation signal transduction histidine kinase
MAGFSYLFMNRAIERWFTQIPENVVREARNVEQQAIADQFVQGCKRRHQCLPRLSVCVQVDEAELKKFAAQLGHLTHIEIVSLIPAETLARSGTAAAEPESFEAALESREGGES